MNLSRTVPLIVILLLSLTAPLFASRYSDLLLTVNPNANTIDIYYWSNQSSDGCSGLNIGGQYRVKLVLRNSSFGSDITLYSPVFTPNCYGSLSNPQEYCSGSVTITNSTYINCNMYQLYYANTSIPSAYTCESKYSSIWSSVRNGDITILTYPGGLDTYVDDTSHACGPYYSYGRSCWYNTTWVTGLYSATNAFIFRDNPECIQCPTIGSYTCNYGSDPYSKYVCSNTHTWILDQSCLSGAWQYCGLNSSSACPSNVTQIEFNFTSCKNDTVCAFNQKCDCSEPIRGINTCNNPSESNGTCRYQNGEYCTDDYQCLYNLCINKDNTGRGRCAYMCNSNADCQSIVWDTTVTSGQCKTLTGSSYTYWCGPNPSDYCTRGYYPNTYCVFGLGNICKNGDSCFSQNCQPKCDGLGLFNTCTVPGYSCYCSQNQNCPVGYSCITKTLTSDITGSSKVCVQGISNAQSCASSSECASGNCNNGICCDSGEICCSTDSQCAQGYVCFNYDGWEGTSKYDTCRIKQVSGSTCGDNKECISGQCQSHICIGGEIPTSYTYNVTYQTFPVLVNTNVTFHLNYLKFEDGTLVPEPTVCKFYSNGIEQASGSCTSYFIKNFTISGSYPIKILATKLGYQTQEGYIININVNLGVPPSSLRNGERCTSGTDCQSNRCEYVTDISSLSGSESQCFVDSDCSSTEYCYGSTIQGVCGQSNSCFGFPLVQCRSGLCINSGSCILRSQVQTYAICCNNDSYQCCDSVSPSGGRCVTGTCDPFKATCSVATRGIGQTCNQTLSECSQSTCHVTYNPSKSVCCNGASQQDYCCQNNVDCPSGYVCDISLGRGNYVCTLQQGGTIRALCSSDDFCIGNGQNLECINGICSTKNCGSNTPCLYCNNTNYQDVASCHNSGNIMTIRCVQGTSCTVSGGQNPSNPTPVAGVVTVEDLFYQLLTLLYWVMAVVIIFFIIALFMSGLHLAYGLVKR